MPDSTIANLTALTTPVGTEEVPLNASGTDKKITLANILKLLISTNVLSASKAVVTDSSGFLSTSAATAAQIGYLSSLSSDVQTQLNGKQASLGYTAENVANKGIASGYCDLDGSVHVPLSRLSGITTTQIAAGAAILKSQLAALAIVDADVSAISESKVTNLTSDLASKIGTGAILDSTRNTDTTTGTVARGDVITGQGATPKWTRLALGSSGQVIYSNGTDIIWHTLAESDIANLVSDLAGKQATLSDAANIVYSDQAATMTAAKTFTSKLLKVADIADANANIGIGITATTSAVDYLTVVNAATANPAVLQVNASGSDANVGIQFSPKGTGPLRFTDGADVTKILAFALSGATTAKTMTIASSHTNNRTLTLPDITDTLAVLGQLTDGATITGIVNTQIANGAAIDKSKIANTAVTLSDTQTLTNKTLTNPIISSISNTGTVTLPTATDTLVARATTDTLSNKTLASPVITGTITTYNGLTTAGLGVPVIIASVSQKSESGADANLLTATSLAAGSYRLRVVINCSTATSLVGLGWTATYTDSNGTAQTPTNISFFHMGASATALTATTTGNYYGEAQIDIDGSANIVLKLTYTSGTLACKVSATIERLI